MFPTDCYCDAHEHRIDSLYVSSILNRLLWQTGHVIGLYREIFLYILLFCCYFYIDVFYISFYFYAFCGCCLSWFSYL